ncbi:MAG: hypothetical protein KAX15_05775 [Candidatus Omnitrophica bacterium]|nr:hypothetical protein [Candidatus Omnitrophota bacterium]
MKNNSVDKKKGKPLSRDDRSKYRGMKEHCISRMKYLKKEGADLQAFNNECRIIIKEHQVKIEKLKAPGQGSTEPDPKVKKAMDQLSQEVELSRAIIKHQWHKINRNKDLIRKIRNNATRYWRDLERYKDLVFQNIPWEKKDL